MGKLMIGYTTVTWAESRQEGWLEKGISDIASLGFNAFETFAGTAMEYDAPGGGFKELIAKHSIRLVCLDVWADYQDPAQRSEILAHHKGAIEFLQAHGGNILLTVPSHAEGKERWGDEEFENAAETLNEVGRICLDYGVKNCLHPHWGTFVESREEIQHILDATDPRFVFFAPDCGQIAKGEADPVALARQYAERIGHVHVKDVAENWPELRRQGYSLAMPEGYAPLGEGIVDIRGFVEAVVKADVDAYLMGELDKVADPKGAAAISKRFLVEEMGFSL